MLYRVVHEEPQLHGVPDALAPLVRACLAKDPEERPSTLQLSLRLKEIAAREAQGLAEVRPPAPRTDPDRPTGRLAEQYTERYTEQRTQRRPQGTPRRVRAERTAAAHGRGHAPLPRGTPAAPAADPLPAVAPGGPRPGPPAPAGGPPTRGCCVSGSSCSSW